MCKIVYISIPKYIIFCGQTFVLYHILWTNICVLLYSVDKYLRFIIFCGQIFVLYHILWTNICVVSYSVDKYLGCIIFCGQSGAENSEEKTNSRLVGFCGDPAMPGYRKPLEIKTLSKYQIQSRSCMCLNIL